MRPVPQEAFEIVKHFEGLYLKAYLCPAGIPSIGWGATGADIKLGMVVTKSWAESRLQSDLEARMPQLLKLCPALIDQSDKRVAAVLSWLFNLGSTRLAASTLRRKINAREWNSAAKEFPKWVYGNGRKLPGLIIRREAERQLFLS